MATTLRTSTCCCRAISIFVLGVARLAHVERPVRNLVLSPTHRKQRCCTTLQRGLPGSRIAARGKVALERRRKRLLQYDQQATAYIGRSKDKCMYECQILRPHNSPVIIAQAAEGERQKKRKKTAITSPLFFLTEGGSVARNPVILWASWRRFACVYS